MALLTVMNCMFAIALGFFVLSQIDLHAYITATCIYMYLLRIPRVIFRDPVFFFPTHWQYKNLKLLTGNYM